MASVSRVPRSAVAGAYALDAALVVVFAVIGRASHGESGIFGLLQTIWPFVTALSLAWIASLLGRVPVTAVSTGFGIWMVTIVGGMLLRALSGQSTAFAFVIVASGVLLAFLVGWRVVVAFVVRHRERTAA